ncbi:16S rRNA (guanine(527)-N(7))-methyltransferase RsmG [Alphaproteobacteria bacterium LSUCC0684]
MPEIGPDTATGPLTPEDVGEQLNVSRETLNRLRCYVDLLSHWQKSINLVSKASLADVWRRHILDSGQLFAHLDEPDQQIMDIGSGAGLPGLVLAIMGAGNAEKPVICVESDERKCAFLAVAARECDVPLKVITARLETLAPMQPKYITARALAPFEKLLDLTRNQHHAGLECLFLKGERYQEELTSLGNSTTIKIDVRNSLSSPESVILKVSGFSD